MNKLGFVILFIFAINLKTEAKDIPKIFKEICSNCHGEKGEKNDAFSAIGGKSVKELIESMNFYKNGGDKYGMGVVMQGRVEDFTDSEIEKMAEYVNSLKK